MKRDMDLIRAILLDIEACDDAHGLGQVVVRMDGYTDQQVACHLLLSRDAGLIDCDDGRIYGVGEEAEVIMPGVTRLTWQGHEFIDAFRDDTTWQRVKSGVVKHAGALTFEALKAAATAIASTAGGHVGQMFSP